jgi:hypothetical protein
VEATALLSLLPWKLTVRVDLSLMHAGNLFALACLNESHRPMNVLVVNRKTLRLPTVQPEDSPDCATFRKAIQKHFDFLIFWQSPQFCSTPQEVLSDCFLIEFC